MKKLEKEDKIVMGLCGFMAIFDIFKAIILKDSTWGVCAFLWGDIAMIQFFNAIIIKGKDYLIENKEKQIKLQEETIDNLSKELLEKNIVYLEDIKIPKYYVEPNQKKMSERLHYFKEHKKLKAPILIDKNNNLVDGYTSYLIAKKYNFMAVEVTVVSNEK